MTDIDISSDTVSVCIATYRRPERLRCALEDLSKQTRLPDQVVVVDNDPNASGRQIVEHCRTAGLPYRIEYDVQPVPGIAITRNRTVELATGRWIAFLDDDERAPEDWLEKLRRAAAEYAADGVLGPVEPQVPDSAPAWIRRGRFYDFPHQNDGVEVPLNCMRFGNVLLRADRLRSAAGPFDTALGLMAGEDVDLLVRLAHGGAKIVWYDQAPVYEPVEQQRLSLRWLVMRALSGGQGFARYTIRGGFCPIGPWGICVFFARAALQMIVALGLSFLALPFGRHRVASWLITAGANLGKLTVLWGWRYSAYARRPH